MFAVGVGRYLCLCERVEAPRVAGAWTVRYWRWVKFQTFSSTLFLVCLLHNLSYILCVCESPSPSPLAMEKQFEWI